MMPSNLPSDCTQAELDALMETTEQALERERWESLSPEQRDRVWPRWREEMER